MAPLLRADAGAKLDEIVVCVDDGSLEWLGSLAIVDALVESDPTTAILDGLTDFWPRHSTTHGHHLLKRELLVQGPRESN